MITELNKRPGHEWAGRAIGKKKPNLISKFLKFDRLPVKPTE
jgi:hypothetical protein